MKKIFTLMLLFCTVTAFTQNIRMAPLEIPTARSSRMGGRFTAYTDDVFALLVNPAAIIHVEQRSFFSLSPTFYSPQTTFGILDSMIDAIGGDVSSFGKAANLISKRGDGKAPIGFELNEFPFSISWVANGIGFGIWNRTIVNANIIGTNVTYNVMEDIIMPIGFAMKVWDNGDHKIDVGINVKPFFRVLAKDTVRILDLLDDDYDFLDSTSIPFMFGFGFDIGFMYRWDMGLNAGITFKDIVTRGFVITDFVASKNNDRYYIPFTINLGVAYDFKLGKFWDNLPSFFANMGITFAFEWNDFTNVFMQSDYRNQRNAALNIGMGLQITMLDKIMLSIGMKEMLPAWGIGFDLGVFQIDFAYYGKELGNEPGQLSVPAIDVTIAIRPKAKHREWPWVRRTIVEMITGEHPEKD